MGMRASPGGATHRLGGLPDLSKVTERCSARQATVPAGARAATAVDPILGVQQLAGVLAALSSLHSQERVGGTVPSNSWAQVQARGNFQIRNP